MEVAAAALRRHLEYASYHLADHLGASLAFHANAKYELGELLPAVLSRMKKLCGMAAAAAQSWGKEDEKAAVLARKALLSTTSAGINVENWVINPAVHYNNWTNFGRNDFAPVVAVFKELLNCFRCADCQSWLYASPKHGEAELLRCACGSVNMNLKSRPK